MDWIPIIVTFFLGLVSALGLEFGKSQIERRQRRQDRRDDFERERLTALLDPAHQLLSFLEKWYGSQYRDYLETGEWVYSPDVPSLNREESLEYNRARVALQTASYLVADEAVRERVEKVLRDVPRTFNAESGAAVLESYKAMNEAYLAAIKRIGELLRSR